MVHGKGIGLLAERAIYQMLEDGRLVRWRQAIAGQVAAHRRNRIAALIRAGIRFEEVGSGLFLWIDMGPGNASRAVAEEMRTARWALAPSEMFSYNDEHLCHTRLNVTTTSDEALSYLGGRVRERTGVK